ncbi:MAG: threonylcarbamoyl-AMP synthase [Chloroflexi bacterium]|nr:threonylcarbamoyl-AMP synthase [Chloroflexota bacterium]
MSHKLTSDVESQVAEALRILKEGGVVAFPTDTVYGIGAAADKERALETIFELKGRPRGKPLQVFLSRVEDMTAVAQDVPDAAWRLAKALLPGGLTLVLGKQAWLSDIVTAAGDTVAIRIPAHPVPIALVEGLGAPLVATSANLSGQPSAVTAEEARRQLDDRVALIIDAGPAPAGRESTIIDLTGSTPRILRQGMVSREEVEAALGSHVLR